MKDTPCCPLAGHIEMRALVPIPCSCMHCTSHFQVHHSYINEPVTAVAGVRGLNGMSTIAWTGSMDMKVKGHMRVQLG
jgi:hypothetical protein